MIPATAVHTCSAKSAVSSETDLSRSVLPPVERCSLQRYFERIETLSSAITTARRDISALLKNIYAYEETTATPVAEQTKKDIRKFLRESQSTLKLMAAQIKCGLLVGEDLRYSGASIAHGEFRVRRLAEIIHWKSVLEDPQLLKTVQSMQAVAHLTEHFERGMRRGSIVPGTRFRLGAINTADQIRSLYDWPEYQARLTSMRPNKSSTAGFLGPKEDLVEVLLSDHLEMQKLGVTNVQLGQWLQRLLTRGRMTLHHQRLDCGAQFSTMGSQTPPLPGPLERGQSEFNPFNRDSGFRILGNVTELHPGLIELWGFCEGRQCSYTEPQQLELLNELEALTKHKVPQWMRDKYSKPQTYRIEPADLVRLFFGESR